MVMQSSTDDHNSGGVVLSSSIALLQERFRQLQKMKKLRQEKELLRILSESERSSSPSPPPVSQNRTCSGPELKFVPLKVQRCELSLSLRPDSVENKEAGFRGTTKGPPNLRGSWFADEPLLCTWPSAIRVANSGCFDVDTDLRL